MAPPLPSPAPSIAAHATFASSLVPDLPLLMHGSGDVEPSRVDPDSVSVLADLTAQYVSRLVSAAVDAHDIQTDGAGGLCPPPPPARSCERDASSRTRTKKRPRGYDAAAVSSAAKSSGGDDDFWDEPLPEPKVKKASSFAAGGSTAVMAYGSFSGGMLGMNSYVSASQAGAEEDDDDDDDVDDDVDDDDDEEDDDDDDDDDENAPVHHSEWVGLVGVDVFSQRRRAPYASIPTAIGTQCFIFPICHDAALYSRVMEVQAARRNIAPIILDPVLMDTVRDEGRALILREKEGGDAVAESAAVDEVEAEVRAARLGPGDEAIWPGLGDVLPTHRGSA